LASAINTLNQSSSLFPIASKAGELHSGVATKLIHNVNINQEILNYDIYVQIKSKLTLCLTLIPVGGSLGAKFGFSVEHLVVSTMFVQGERRIGGRRRVLGVLNVLVVLVVVLEVLGYVVVLVGKVGLLAQLALGEGGVHFGDVRLLALLLVCILARLGQRLARTEALASNSNACLVDAVVVVETAQGAVCPVVGTTVE